MALAYCTQLAFVAAIAFSGRMLVRFIRRTAS
jgi:hypothetical protein